MKTLAIRLEDDLSAQLSILAQLEATSVTDLIRSAIAELIDRKRGEGNLAARAQAAIAELETEAQARRSAIQSLFGSTPAEEATEGEPVPTELAPPSDARPRSRRKPDGATS